MLDTPAPVGGGLQPLVGLFHSCRYGHRHPRWAKGKWGQAQTRRGTAGLAVRGQPETQAQCGPACAWEAHSSCPGQLSPWSLFFFFSEDRVFSEAAPPTWVESLGQKEALVGVLAHLLCFTC